MKNKEDKEKLKLETKAKKLEEKAKKLEAKVEKERQRLEEKTKKLEEKTKLLEEKKLDEINTMTQSIKGLINKQSTKMNYEPKFEIICSNNNKIEKIIHIADIHIRLTEMHKEYNIVFERFYENLRKLKIKNINALVCLCGDLLHSKDELKPNTILHTWNFLKNISQIFPLIIIAGNHDTIEQNDDKIDAISAILKDRPIDNIHYLVNSGAYQYNNIVFGVSSIIDKYLLTKDKLDSLI